MIGYAESHRAYLHRGLIRFGYFAPGMPTIRKQVMKLGLLSLLGSGCWSAEQEHPAGVPAANHSAPESRPWIESSALGPFDFPMVEDNLEHDTLLVQVTFDLLDGTYIMVASNRQETFEGLRLYRYRLNPNGTPEMLTISTPAYDSWTMLPTFFPEEPSTPSGALWVLANFGEKESWGQKLLRLNQDFTDLGFLDVAVPERLVEDDTLRLKRRSIAPFTRLMRSGDTTTFSFACDSVYLYDDQEGGLDVVLHASRVRYTYERNGGLALWVDGRKRTIKTPV